MSEIHEGFERSERVWWPGELYHYRGRGVDPSDFWRDIDMAEGYLPDSPALRKKAENPELELVALSREDWQWLAVGLHDAWADRGEEIAASIEQQIDVQEAG